MIKAIFATDIQGGMGRNGSLPWPHDKQDMQFFKSNTINDVVVMGSSTWADPGMPKPLPNRHCVVVTNQDLKLFSTAHDVIAGHHLLPSLEVLELQHPDQTIWIIGGAKLLTSCHPVIREIYLTTFMDQFDCDVKLDMANYLEPFFKTTEDYGRNKIFTTWVRK